MARPGAFVLVVATVLACVAADARVDLGRNPPSTASDCDALARSNPHDLEAYRCYLVVARRNQRWSEAISHLEARLRVDPDDAGALLYLGWIEADRYQPRAIDLLKTAVDRFEVKGNAMGEVRSRLILAHVLLALGRGDDAVSQLDRAETVARNTGDPILIGHTLVQRAHVAEYGGDVAVARALLEDARAMLDATDTDSFLNGRIEGSLASLAWFQGRLGDAVEHYRAAAEEARRIGDRYAEADDRYNMAVTAARLASTSGTVGREEVARLVRHAAEAGVAGGNPRAEASARLLLAQDRHLDVAGRVREAERALELTRNAGAGQARCFAPRVLALLVVERDGDGGRDRAFDLLDEALDAARSIGSLADVARARIVRASLAMRFGPREAVIAEYQAAIDAVESMRDRQSDQLVRARFMWDWAFVYYRLAGFLLEPVGEPPSLEDADLAFRTVERLRSRILLDTLDAARATSVVSAGRGPDDGGLRAERGEILDRIVATQRTLRIPGLSEDDAHAAVAELDRLELREAELRSRIAAADPSFARLRKPGIPGIADIRSDLQPDQAVLTFQLSNRETGADHTYWNGGSWVIAITTDDLTVVPLPDDDVLRERVAVFLGLVERRNPLEPEAAERLYLDLLDEAMTALPGHIRRLVIVPDDVLHRLPFGALRNASDPAPLAMRYEISIVPSAALWHHWKTNPVADTHSDVLALADPEWPGSRTGAGADGEHRGSTPGTEALGPLPNARSEAKVMARAIGGRSTIRTGGAASEDFLKTVDLGSFGIVHLAAHAVVDSREPQRSAVVLAPGSEDQDGLLQIREIVTLDFDDSTVILSACSSATGELTEGEGVVGLARSFFQAGARAVVASLWPLRDDEAAILVSEVAANLGTGTSVGEAVAVARRVAHRNGLATAAWAGLIVLGDGDHVPVPGGGRPPVPQWVWVVSLTFAAVIPGVLGFLRLRRSRKRAEA